MPPKAPGGRGGGGVAKDKKGTGTTTSKAGSDPATSSNATPPQQDRVEPEASTIPNAASSVAPTRLESLKPSSSATSSPRGRKGPIAKPKFVGRRSQAARAELEREEAAKKAAEEAEELQNARKQKRPGQGFGGDRGRGRGGRGRGRGGFAGDSQRVPIASGPFSSGQATQDIRSGYIKRAGWGGNSGGGSSGASGGGAGPQSRSWGNGGSRTTSDGIKIEGSGEMLMSGTGRMRSVKTEDGGYISSDDEDFDGVLKKQNIDELQNELVDLTSAEDDLHGNPFAPIRLSRAPVKDRKVGLSAEEVSKRSTEDEVASDLPNQVADKKKGKASVRDVEITGSTERPRRATAYSSSSDTEDKDEVKVKTEPADDEPDLDPVGTTALTSLVDTSGTDSKPVKDIPSSPESKRKAKETLKSTMNSADPEDLFKRPKTPTYPTQQEVDEFHRKWDDRATVYTELGRVVERKTSALETATDDEGNVKMADSSTEKSVRDDQVYIFQFPPILPDLYPIEVKSDPDAPEINDAHNEAMDVEQENKKSSKEGAKMKIEDGQSQDAHPHLPAGRVGKLRVHKSGRAYLDWGGKNTLMLELGIPSSCLQNVMIAKIPDIKPDVESDHQSSNVGRAMGLGEVKQKFVLIPQFD